MNDSKSNLTEEELKLIEEEELFMQEVYNDPRAAEAMPPVEMHAKVFAEIRAREKKKQEAELAEEKRRADELEFIKLEKRYKRAVRMQKWVVLAAVLVMAMSFSLVTIGGPEKIIERMISVLTGREQVNVDSGHEDISNTSDMSEEEAYQEVEDTFGFVPVGLGYLPTDVIFMEANIGEEIQSIQMLYGKDDEVKIGLLIRPNYQVSSMGKDMEDDFVEEYVENNEYTTIYTRKYLVDGTEERWSVQFEYQKVSYSMTIMDTSQEEVKKITENLYFPLQ